MSQDKRHPKTVYDAKYPYNRIEITESGHEIHYDDTPGKERIRRSHKSGTYEEISHDGKVVRMSVGNLIEYAKQGKTTTVDKNHDEKIGGSSRVSIGGGSHTEVKGNMSSAVDGDLKTMVGKDSVSAVKGDMVMGVGGATKLRMAGGMELKGDGTKDVKIDGAANLQFGSTLQIYSKEKNFTHSDEEILLKVGSASIKLIDGEITIAVGGTHIILREAIMHIKSTEVRIGGGSSVHVKSVINLVDPPWVTGAAEPE